MRDHTKLKAFALADELVLAVYRATQTFPSEERFGLSNQLRRSSLSTASNIVEGCARRTEADYLRFLDIAHASAREVEYQLSVAVRLGFLPPDEDLPNQAIEVSKVLNGLIRNLIS
ncbi:MAG: four helix bundle protein [Acidobacteria bacterium]|nr:four helix bundle protein [Acidobacteriota bacterium]